MICVEMSPEPIPIPRVLLRRMEPEPDCAREETNSTTRDRRNLQFRKFWKWGKKVGRG